MLRNPTKLTRASVNNAMLVLLLCGAGLGLVWDILTLAEAIREQGQRGGDHLGMFFPMVGVFLFAPVQLAAAIAFKATLRRRRAQPVTGDNSYAQASALADQQIIDADFAALERATGVGTIRAAVIMMGAPGIVMMIFALHQLTGIGYGLVQALTGNVSLIWMLSWFGGVVAGGIALGRYGEPAPLALAPLYPVFGFIYTFA